MLYSTLFSFWLLLIFLFASLIPCGSMSSNILMPSYFILNCSREAVISISADNILNAFKGVWWLPQGLISQIIPLAFPIPIFMLNQKEKSNMSKFVNAYIKSL